MINILTLETTGRYGSAAVIRDDGRVCCASSRAEMNHLRDIISLSDQALRDAGIAKSELTHIAASRGPGSFTGIRIGVTTARTMAQVLGLPCIGVSSLEALALRALDRASGAGAVYIAAVINARRHQTYAGSWTAAFAEDSGETALIPEMEERQYMIEDFTAAMAAKAAREHAPVFFTGDGVDAYEDIIRGCFSDAGAGGLLIIADEDIRYQMADAAARIALSKARHGDVTGYDGLLPEYMRLSEAEQRLKDGTLSDKIRRASGYDRSDR